jgi:hypothetical protein
LQIAGVNDGYFCLVVRFLSSCSDFLSSNFLLMQLQDVFGPDGRFAVPKRPPFFFSPVQASPS